MARRLLRATSRGRRRSFLLSPPLLGAWLLLVAISAQAQNRGVYPLGLSAVNSGLTPESGFSYSNQFLYYSRDKAKDDNGNTLPITGNNFVLLDMNTFTWVSKDPIFLGVRYSASATLPFAKNDLTSDLQGNISGGSGFGDSYFLPLILSWTGGRIALKAMYGFLAPTGQFAAGANDNVGSGYWTHTLSSGQTYYLTGNKRLTFSAFEVYEFHTEQEGTGIHPGDTFNLDYSLMGTLVQNSGFRLQLGLAGYEARQITSKTGPGISSAVSDERYAINALGAAINLAFPKQKVNVTLKFFDEFADRATYEGYSFQIAESISF
ncbi:MAG: SphA family protein [Chthoniobacterales bacterium]